MLSLLSGIIIASTFVEWSSLGIDMVNGGVNSLSGKINKLYYYTQIIQGPITVLLYKLFIIGVKSCKRAAISQLKLAVSKYLMSDQVRIHELFNLWLYLYSHHLHEVFYFQTEFYCLVS